MTRSLFVMPIKNNRPQKIKVMQNEKKRNDIIRKTGIIPSIKNYSQCPHCKEQILNSMYTHHISNCSNAFPQQKPSKCKGCDLFKKKKNLH